MDGIGRVGRLGGPIATNKARPSGALFSVEGGAGKAAGPAAATAPAALDGLLALQEREGDWLRDRPARRHAEALLDELAALQRAVLAGEDDPATLARLASLSRAAPAAADPRLRAVLRAASLRAAVELARRTEK